jgi:CubicO group peptidase (beta-lactamase class C family)
VVTPALAPVDAWLAAEQADDRFSGVVLAARGEEVLLRKGYGEANRSWGVPFTATTKVQIASLTKQFTAAAILKLQDQGVLTVDDSVCRWIEPCPDAWRPMTLHQLMTHTAGVPEVIRRKDYPLTSRRVQTAAEQTSASAALPLDYAPGTRFLYSNGGYQLLGDVIERASGKPYADYLREVFFEPLGMENTGYEDGRAVLPELAQGYDRQDGRIVRPLFRDPSVIFSAGGLYSTAEDLRTWTRALHAGRAISPEALAQMTGRAGPPERYALRPRRGWNLLYAYGVMRAPAGRFVEPAFDDEQVFHTGSWNGFRLYLTHAPAADVTVVVLSNRIDQAGAVLLAAQKAMAASLGRPIPERLAS